MSIDKTILVADDDPDFRTGTKLVLESAGYTVMTAADEDEAERAIAESKPDLILLDIMMNEVDAGFVLAEKHGHDVTIILLSSIADSSVKVFDADRLPVRGVVQKPIKPDVLLEKVAAALGPTANDAGR